MLGEKRSQALLRSEAWDGWEPVAGAAQNPKGTAEKEGPGSGAKRLSEGGEALKTHGIFFTPRDEGRDFPRGSIPTWSWRTAVRTKPG